MSQNPKTRASRLGFPEHPSRPAIDPPPAAAVVLSDALVGLAHDLALARREIVVLKRETATLISQLEFADRGDHHGTP
jgi:hypothetical protein